MITTEEQGTIAMLSRTVKKFMFSLHSIATLKRKAATVLVLAALANLASPSKSLAFDPLESSSGLSTIDEDKANDNLDLQPTDVIHWTGVQALLRDDGTVDLGLRLNTSNGFSIYKSKLKFTPPTGFSVTKVAFPKSFQQSDPLNPDQMVEVFRGGDFVVTLDSLTAIEQSDINLDVTFLGCTKRICLFPYTVTMNLPVYKQDSDLSLEPAESSADSEDYSNSGVNSKKIGKLDSRPANDGLSGLSHYAELLEKGELQISMLLLVVFLGGLLTNLTPCVFPMVPITLRILGNQKGSPAVNSLLYATGIVLTYSSIGIFVALSGGLFGSLLGNPWVTSFFGVLFLILAFTMLGFGNLASIQTLGAKLGTKKPSALNTLMMGAGAGFVAAPCTGPILGALIVYAAKLQSSIISASLFLLYSSGFALPYVFLGMASSKIRKISVSATLQLAIKILFAAIMFALAFYYLKTPIYKELDNIRGNWWLISLVGIGLGGLASLIILRSPKIQQNKIVSIGPTLVLGLGIFSAIQWVSGQDVISQLKWHKDEAKVFAMAKSENKPILVDGWADWCVACKEMDNTTFRNPAVIKELESKWILLKLDLTEINDASYALAEKYGMPGLPTLVLIASDGDIEKGKRLTSYQSAEQLLKELKAFHRE